jgi:hypothetical protein
VARNVLPTPTGPHDDGVVAGLDEAQRAQLVPGGVAGGDFGGVVPAVQGHDRVESGGAGLFLAPSKMSAEQPPPAVDDAHLKVGQLKALMAQQQSTMDDINLLLQADQP